MTRSVGQALPQAPPSPDVARVACDHAHRCGGCPLIELNYGDQLAHKHAKVAQAASRYPALAELSVAPALGADPVVGYRTRAKLIVAPGGRVGLYEKGGGHEVFDIPRCRVLSPALVSVADALRARVTRDEAAHGPLAPWDGHDGSTLRAIDLREVHPREEAPMGVLVTFVVERSPALRLEQLREAARTLAAEIGSVLGVAVNFHEGEDPQILGRETSLLYGEATTADRVGASTHLATFGSFVQAHRGQAERVHRLVADAVLGSRATRPRVLDLYGGSGAIAIALASKGAEVVLVESFAPAAARAEAAAKKQGLPLSVVPGDVAIALASLGRKGAFDAIVMNPPRRGMSAAARDGAARVGAATLIYVSCDPSTLARDMDHFVRLGYRATELLPLDMIPLTDQVETIAVLRQAPVPGPRRLYEDDEVLAVEKGPHEPTTPQGEYAGSLLARVQSLKGSEDAVPIHRLDVGTSGVVFFARSPSFAFAWSRALHSPSARKVYVAAVRGAIPETGEVTRELREGKKARKASTGYLRLALRAGHSLVEVVPGQGRTHQIRRHLSAIGHPVLGDTRYGHAATNRFFEEKHGLDRTFLHCARVELDHPTSGKRLVIEAPLAGDLKTVLERLA
jgi:23S rRNA (uracil1939-C5)-methyltransferase